MVFDLCSFFRRAVRFGLCSSIQALTLDGVVEIKNQHFWSIAFGSYVSTYPIHVLQVVAAHCTGSAAVHPSSLLVTLDSLPSCRRVPSMFG